MSALRLDVEPHVTVRIQACGGDASIEGHDEAVVEIEGEHDVDRYVRSEGSEVSIAGYPTDLSLRVPRGASVELFGIGGDLEVREVAQRGEGEAKLTVHSVGGDVEIGDVPHVKLGAVGGDVQITDRCRSVEIGHVGGDLELDFAESCTIQSVGGDVELRRVGRLHSLGNVGGDLAIHWDDESSVSDGGDLRVIVGGDAELSLPRRADLTLQATVGGDLEGHGEGWSMELNAGHHTLVFGDGSNKLSLAVGGDVEIHGGQAPESSSSRSGDWSDMRGSMDAFGEEMRGLGRELEEMGRNLARELSGLGRDIAREVRVAGREASRGMKEESSYRGRGPRVRFRVNDRNFDLDPEQIERIKREARAAAASGIARAQEAVEQALRQWQQPNVGGRPVPTRPPTPPRAPDAPPRGSVYTGQTIRMDAPDAPAPPAPPNPADRDTERLAILRMVHEGRLSPDEAEMLLRGLEDR